LIHFSFLAPLAIGGLVAYTRERRRRKRMAVRLAAPPGILLGPPDAEPSRFAGNAVLADDVAAVHHYQSAANFALAFSAAGAVFYTPLALVSVPLLGYSTVNWLQALQRSKPERRRSPATLFEMLGLVGSLAMGRWLMASLVFSFAFTARKWWLQAGNLALIGIPASLSRSTNSLWIRRGDAEIEIAPLELQRDDIVVVHTGDVLTIDGTVIEGAGFFEQLGLSGYLEGVPKQPGDPVFAFTRVAVGDFAVRPR